MDGVDVKKITDETFTKDKKTKKEKKLECISPANNSWIFFSHFIFFRGNCRSYPAIPALQIYMYINMNKTMCIYMPMNKYTCIMYIYIHLYRHMYVEMYKHIHVYTCVYTYLHLHTYIHMYIHMCTHEHTQMRSISAEPAGLAAGPAGRDNRPGRPGWTAGWSGPARETSCCGPAKQPGG